MKLIQRIKEKYPKNKGMALDSLIGFLVLFGIAIMIVVVLVVLNKFI